MSPASLLQLLDRQGWGVRTEVTRRFATRFTSVTLEASWDDDPTGSGRVESRRLALLAVFQEWLVARSHLVGRLVDTVERLRPGYLPAELVDRVRTARASGALLTPESETLDGPALLRLAALVVPAEQLAAQLDRVLEETRREVLAAPSYRGRDDLVPSLDRGLLLLRASVSRSIAVAAFRAAHLREVLTLEAELRKQQRAKRERREEYGSASASGSSLSSVSGGGSSLMNMWFREPKSGSSTSGGGAAPFSSSSSSMGGEATSNSANTRLYSGQLAPEAPPWMAREERQAAAAAPAGRCGPRGLRAGRVGGATFRTQPGVLMCSDAGRPGCGSFGGTDRLSFNSLDAAMTDLMAKANYEVPAAAMSAFARLHRTALLDALSEWQWRQLEAEGGPRAVAAFYQPRCSHATAIRPAGPLLVGRRTRLDVAPGPELDSLRSLARRRGSEVLSVVHPLARKQVVSQGEWEYWREAYRLWDRFGPVPKLWRTATMSLVLTPEQLPYVSLVEADAGGADPTAAAAALAAAAVTTELEDIDMSSLTSMSSLDFDDAPLPAGVAAAAAAAAASAAAPASASAAPAPATASGSGGGSGAAAPTESTLEIYMPPEELRRFLLAMLELLPSHVGDAAAAAMAAAVSSPGSGSAPQLRGARSAAATAAAAAAAATVGEWLPASATALQIRYSPVTAPAARVPGAAAASTAAAGATPGGSGGSGASRLPEEVEASCYELRWAQGAATLSTAPASSSGVPAAPAAAAAAGSRGGGGGGAARWCPPLRLTQAQLLSLVNIFTDLAAQVPDQYGIQPARLVVRTLSPLERLVSAAQAVAGSVLGVAGLLALLAVPLAAAIKAGGGDLNNMMAATPGGRFAGRLVAAAAAAPAAALREAAAAPRPARATSWAEADGGSSNAAAAAAGASATTAALPDVSVADLAAVCRELETGLEGRMWLEVTGTSAATTAGASGREVDEATAERLLGAWPEFQVVVEGRRDAAAAASTSTGSGSGGGGGVTVRVLGCRPVNAGGRTVYGHLPLAAALRGQSAEKAVKSYLDGLTRERIEKGKATPGSYDLRYKAAMYQRLPAADAALAVGGQPPAAASNTRTPHFAAQDAWTPAADAGSAAADVAQAGTAATHLSAFADKEPPACTSGLASPSPSSSSPAATVQSPPVHHHQVGSPAAPPPDAASSPASSVTATGAGEGSAGTATVAAGAEAATPALQSPEAEGIQTVAPERPADGAPGPQPSSPSSWVSVLKLELRPSADPSSHVLQGRGGKRQREFAPADVVVRPWYDSDSLLLWIDGGRVQLPTLAAEIQGGLLAAEEAQRAAFLREYDRLTAPAAPVPASPAISGTGEVEAAGEAAEAYGEEAGAHLGAEGRECPAMEEQQVEAKAGAEAVGEQGPGPVLQPQQLSEQQLQEALQHLFASLGVPAGQVRVSNPSDGGGPSGQQ